MPERRDHWSHRHYCDAVEAEAVRFATIVAGTDPASPVPSCPGWTIADLVKHHGTSQRRVEYVVRQRSQQPVWSKDVETGIPDDPADYPAWLAAGIGPLVATLRAADPDTPMWTNGVDQHASYWARRILYEAVVHRADAELALGRKPYVDADTAANGIDEFLMNLLCFSWVAERIRMLHRDGQTLHLHATDSVGGWAIHLQCGAFTWERGHRQGTVAVQGSTSDLLLLICGRLSASGGNFAVFGDDGLLTVWLENSAL